MDEGQDIRPSWMEDGKGIRGDAQPLNFPKLDFPSAQPVTFQSAQVSRMEPENPIGGGTPSSEPGSSSPSQKPDFSLYDAGSGNLGITNGTVAGPSFPAALPTGGSPAMTPGGSPAALFSAGGSGYAWLAVTWTGNTSGSTVTGVAIATGSSVPANTSTMQYISLGDYNNTGSAITIGSGAAGIGSQTVQICNATFLP